jgi:Flp pilus assembly protein TadG
MAMVEMVFVLPLLILLLFAIAEFGLMFSRWLTLSNAVREGARTGVMYRAWTCPDDKTNVENEVKQSVVTYAKAGGIPLTTSDVNVGKVGGVGGACGGSGTPLKVDAAYKFMLNIPFASLSSVNLSYSSTMINE